MTAIDVIVPGRGMRRWQSVVVERLRDAGHDVGIVHGPAAAWPWTADLILGFERLALRKASRLAEVVEAPAAIRLDRTAGMTIDLTKDVRFDGGTETAALAALVDGRLPEVTVWQGGGVAATAAPMADTRVLVARSLDDVLARAITLVVAVANGRTFGVAPAPPETSAALLAPYVLSAMPRLARDVLRRMRYRHAHWRVGYRLNDGPGVAETGALGSGWSVLPDDGSRFYADPFAVEHEGRTWVFVEDYPHATGKAVISVSELGTDGRLSAPRPVLEEPWHLSYPQVFLRDGQIWMIPEGIGGRSVVLYRAEAFPGRWVRHTVLVEDRELSDATLLEHGGKFWLFATDRDGYGSTSDTLVVYHADGLEGPWRPHAQNPILIDRAAARPGGAFIRVGERLLLPSQDGTLGYGGGLGFSELLRLDESVVELGRPKPIDAAGDFPHPQIHTYNRAGRLEVIDGIAQVRR